MEKLEDNGIIKKKQKHEKEFNVNAAKVNGTIATNTE